MVQRALVLAAAFAAALTPVACLGESSKPLPAKATQELPPELLALLEQKKMPKYSPIVVRVFKEEAELEVWKQDTAGRFQILKTYPICRWSGDLGPKLYEGDRQAPEGFYTITPELMNPNSNFHLSINFGFPNSFDKAHKRNGSFLMIHGDCLSAGCYAMTDEQISEIYSLARDSLSGRPSFQVQAYPFRLTPANLARHRNSPNLAFWKMLKVGNDHFETTQREPKVDVCNRTYVFDAQPPPNSSNPLVFNATEKCPPNVVNPGIALRALEKRHADERATARLVEENKKLKRRVGELEQIACRVEADELLHDHPPTVSHEAADGIRIVAKVFDDRDAESLKQLALALIAHPNTVAILGSRDGDTGRLVFARSSDAAGDMNTLMREACSVIDGRGGGKPDMAQGGGKKVEKLAEAIESASERLRNLRGISPS